MKRNKLILFTFLYIAFYMFLPHGVKAYTPVGDDCLDKGECMLVCNYYNTYKGKNGSADVTRQRNISIYYVHKNKKWLLKWEGTNQDRRIWERGPDAFSDVFEKPVYTNAEITASKFKCPKYGYLDMSALNSDNELCFDNDGKYCHGKSNVGTAFGTKASLFTGKGKDYDYADDIKKYFNNWVMGDIPCSELGNTQSSTISKTIKEKINKDFQQNYMKGKAIPSFILNSSAYKTNVEKGVEKMKKACVSEIDEQIKKGEIDSATGEKWKNNINNIDSKDVQDAVDNARDEMADNSDFMLEDYDQPQDCTGIFGDPDDKDSVAFLIQKILDYIKVIAPILVVVLSSIDFVKVVWSSDDESMKKAQQKLGKRLVAAVFLFMLPVLINLMFNLINDSIIDPTCGIQ